MQHRKIRKLRVVSSADSAEFESAYNELAEELADYDPEVEIREVGGKMWAMFHYTVDEVVFETVADEFHAEGIRYTCDCCPLHDEIVDKRVNMVGCKYSEFGETNRKHEACEYFYKMLKQGQVQPLHDYTPPTYRKGR